MKRDLRDRISDKLNDLSDKDLAALVDAALTAEKTIWTEITCKAKDCGHTAKYAVAVPDVQARAKALDILLTQGKGKPPETLRLEATVTAKPLEAMTPAELEAEEARLLQDHPELAEA